MQEAARYGQDLGAHITREIRKRLQTFYYLTSNAGGKRNAPKSALGQMLKPGRFYTLYLPRFFDRQRQAFFAGLNATSPTAEMTMYLLAWLSTLAVLERFILMYPLVENTLWRWAVRSE